MNRSDEIRALLTHERFPRSAKVRPQSRSADDRLCGCPQKKSAGFGARYALWQGQFLEDPVRGRVSM